MEKKSPLAHLLLPLLVVVTFGAIFFILETDFSAPLKFFGAIIVLLGSAKGLSLLTGVQSEWGVILVRTTKGIEIIKKLAKHEEFWKFFADVGTCLAFGLMGYFIVQRTPQGRLKVLGTAMILLTFILFFVSPMVLPFLSISLGLNLGTESGGVTTSTNLLGPIFLMSAVYIGGLSTMVTLSIISYGFTVLGAFVDSVIFGADTISQTSPGVTLILPGINIPFVEGILALILILVVHEGAHATLSVLGRVPLLSSGLAFFGIIPVGAFVEPDEKRLVTKSKEIQTRVVVAGSTSNLITSVIFFILLFAFLFVTAPFKETGWMVVEGMEEGTIIQSINGIELDGVQQLNLTPGETAVLETNYGTIERQADEEGKLGIYYAPLSSAPYTRYNFFPLDFIFRLLALVFCLNFIIGIVNLLPLPLFDGYRLVELNIENKLIPKIIMWVCIVAFLMNFLPWFF